MTGAGESGNVLGWREWVALPELGLPALKAKVDTGARTSALHAFRLETFQSGGRRRVRFWLHPIRRKPGIEVCCEADLVERRVVSDSGGHRERRCVIRSPVEVAGQRWDIEITLTNRDTMLFPMLLGRKALEGRFLVDPEASYLAGRVKGASRRYQR